MNVRRRNTGPFMRQMRPGHNRILCTAGRTADGEVQRRHPRRPRGRHRAHVPLGDGGSPGEELLWKVRLLSQIAAGASFLPDLLNSGRNRAGARVGCGAPPHFHSHPRRVLRRTARGEPRALEVLPKLDAAVLARIEAVLGNHPQEPEAYGRPPLDQGIL
ncbi:hypothetical protein MIND_01431700 [Mycena indigotica]|uniref:Uncharacterized protein n=1 Tax=Mycena indigotica TaxID=2126181 RepID=A0A8H6RXM3_9AGAR|nr:uncharacterized protein MIND_01431700 [Mycena indigotica]KAF7288480.1 hypothetical protein MIND_01431700 [Mycena indigotica]